MSTKTTIPPHMACSLSANLGCRSEMCCTRLAVNAGPKKVAKNRYQGTIETWSGYIFPIKACIDNRKNLLSSNISYTCPDNMVNFGPIAAEIDPVAWGIPQISMGFACWKPYCMHGTQVLGVSYTLRR